jgi:serine protease AprX
MVSNRRVAAAVLAVVISGGAAWINASPATDAFPPLPPTPGLAAVLAAHAPTDVARAIATFDAVPDTTAVTGLRALGLTTQPLRHLPLAIVHGPVAALRSAVERGLASDVYPDEPIELLDQASADAMGAAAARAAGLTGNGVTVAVVDSGCDASHPDLADHVAHNVKLFSAEYLNGRADSSNTLVVPVEQGPYQNTDLGSGHGTHVACIIAADGTTDPGHIGVAPDAELVCLSIGEILFTTAVVTAYDYLLDQPNLWDVDVVNNSWGNSFRQFDPRDPVAVATKAVADLGVTVVFAAGNSGGSVADNDAGRSAEMSLNPFSQAPWVISVAAGTLDHHRASFSSNGLRYDNSQPAQIGAGGHSVFTGDRIGIYHPDVTAPGADISSTCDSAGTPAVIGPCPAPAYGNEVASGTSMASPHVAGAAAVLKQANPLLAPDHVRQALEATATPVMAPNGSPLGFWQVGYGYVDLGRAAALVTHPQWRDELSKAAFAAESRVLFGDGVALPRSDFWAFDAPRLGLGGSDTRRFSTVVAPDTDLLKVTLSHPSLAVANRNGTEWTVTVRDAAGRVLGTTTEATSGAGTASVLLDLSAAKAPVTFGAFTFETVAELAPSDPDTLDSDSVLGRMVTLQVAQIVRV